MLLPRRHLLLSVLAGWVPWARATARPAPPALALPGVWSDRLDPAAYLVSEKYDGVRAHWDGSRLRFRSGRAVPAPAWFTQRLPRIALDGELWLGRGRFDELSAVVRSEQPVDAAWRRVRYMVFDLPGEPGTFEQRARRLDAALRGVAWEQLVAVEQAPVADLDALHARLDATVAQGGEGLMLHRASAAFLSGRSDVTLKLKPALDTEAVVVAHHPGQGKYAGQLGAIEVRTPQGRRFLIGTGFSDAQRRAPPPIGSVVTYRYRSLTNNGLPRFATFVRIHAAL